MGLVCLARFVQYKLTPCGWDTYCVCVCLCGPSVVHVSVWDQLCIMLTHNQGVQLLQAAGMLCSS